MFRISLFIQTRRDCTIFWISVLIQTRRVLLYSGYSFLFRPRGFYYILDMCSYPDQGDSIIFRISVLIQTQGVYYIPDICLYSDQGVLLYLGYQFLFRPGGSTIFWISVLVQTRGFMFLFTGVKKFFIRFLLVKMYSLKEFLHSDLKRCL